MIDKLVREGRVAVLVSYGFGAGWYTWHRDERMLYDPRIVEMVLAFQANEEQDWRAHYEQISKYCADTYQNQYIGGVDGLTVEWVTEGEKFRINEYDGSETLVRESDQKWLTA